MKIINLDHWLLLLLLLSAGCQPADTLTEGEQLPTSAAVAVAPMPTSAMIVIAPASTMTATPTLPPTQTSIPRSTKTPSPTKTLSFIPTKTPRPPTSTPTPTITPTVQMTGTAVIELKPFGSYAYEEIMPVAAYPVPAENNGWGMHWIASTSQSRGTVDKFVGELVRMHIKWVVFLNTGQDTTSNDYLVERLVANGIMPVMRVYQATIEPYGDITPMVRHYRAKGVYYYQLYNEPNTNVENRQSFANPNQYAIAWSATARQVISAGGLPGIGAFSPGGAYDHFEFLQRTLEIMRYNGDLHLLNHAWFSAHNYHGTRELDDPGGFFLFREYNRIIEQQIGRSLPIIGTEAGSYAGTDEAEMPFIRFQYDYMKNEHEPYYLGFSWWILANRAGGHYDDAWEWQALFKEGGYAHPAIANYFYGG